MSNIYQLLTEPFPVEMERTLNKGGVSLVYIPVSEVITRMNKIIGVENWSYEVKTWQQLGTSIVAHVTVTAEIDGKTITRDGVGGQKIKLTKNQEPLDIGDELKGAVSDALKKAAQTLGIGLYLARSDDAMEIEQAIDASNEPPTPHELNWENFKQVSKNLTKSQKDELNNSWINKYKDAPKPTSAKDVTPEVLDFLHTEAVRIQLGGQYVERK